MSPGPAGYAVAEGAHTPDPRSDHGGVKVSGGSADGLAEYSRGAGTYCLWRVRRDQRAAGVDSVREPLIVLSIVLDDRLIRYRTRNEARLSACTGASAEWTAATRP